MNIAYNKSDNVLTGTVDTTAIDADITGAVSNATADIAGATNYLQISPLYTDINNQ